MSRYSFEAHSIWLINATGSSGHAPNLEIATFEVNPPLVSSTSPPPLLHPDSLVSSEILQSRKLQEDLRGWCACSHCDVLYDKYLTLTQSRLSAPSSPPIDSRSLEAKTLHRITPQNLYISCGKREQRTRLALRNAYHQAGLAHTWRYAGLCDDAFCGPPCC